jgi:hypothetical protein
MKLPRFLLPCAVLPLLLVVPCGSAAEPETAAVPLPLGKKCVVSIIAVSATKPVVSGTANVVTGFAAPSIVQGVLIRMDSQWVVLREASEDHWIPLNKVIMVNVSHWRLVIFGGRTEWLIFDRWDQICHSPM